MPLPRDASILAYDPRAGDATRSRLWASLAVCAVLLFGMVAYAAPRSLAPPEPAPLVQVEGEAEMEALLIQGPVKEEPVEAGPAEGASLEMAPMEVVAPVRVALRVESERAAEVLEEGRWLGRTPLSLRLPPGRHTLTLREANGLSTRQSLTLRGGAPAELHVGAATVQVNTPEGAAIWVDGRLLGRAPLALALLEGRYTLSVRGEDWEHTETLDLEAGAKVDYRVRP